MTTRIGVFLTLLFSQFTRLESSNQSQTKTLRKRKIKVRFQKQMRRRTHRKIIERMSTVPEENFGEALYFRPLADDDEIIAIISGQTGEKRSVLAQKLVHLALQGKQFDLELDRKHFSKIDWLVKQEKKRSLKEDIYQTQIERLEEHAREMELSLKRTEENSHFIKIFVAEIYGLTSVCVTLLNQIFTRIIEYFSPVEIEKKNSVEFANRNILELVKHSLSELERISSHHQIKDESTETEMLYLFTKIDLLKARLLPQNVETIAEQK